MRICWIILILFMIGCVLADQIDSKEHFKKKRSKTKEELLLILNEDGEPLTLRGEVACPCCNKLIDKTDNFCKHCGQAKAWMEENTKHE